jgi:glyoxylase-like metal-dependent hydrolase (beta-lactamase superfamily II)
MIKVLFEGIHDNHYGDGYYDINPLTSSVTLIQNEGLNVLIDTGTPAFFPLLKKKLKAHGLTPLDIHHICNSHFHLDHCGNDAFFKRAVVWVGRSSLDYTTGKARIFTDPAKIPRFAGIETIFAPGHTVDSAAYLYEEKGTAFVCAGDAIREDIIRAQLVPHVHLPDAFVPTMKMLFEKADVIIPGHGRVIEGALKEELHGLVCGEWRR